MFVFIYNTTIFFYLDFQNKKKKLKQDKEINVI